MATTQAAGKHAREYETIYVLGPDVARESQEKIAQRMGEAVTREGGKMTTIENWGRRQLAYEVKKAKRGVYVYVKYVGGGAAVAEVERNLRMLDDVLKYQTVQVRDDVDAGTLTVDAEALKFEAVDLPGEDEVEDTIERQLGFEGGPDRSSRDELPAENKQHGASVPSSPIPVPGHVLTLASITIPINANTAFGIHAATSGGMRPLAPTAFVSWISIRKITVVPRLTPMP